MNWERLLVPILCLAYLLLVFPHPGSIAFDPDHAHQLIGGQLVSRGSLPFRDWHASYGPLVFFLSAVGAFWGDYAHLIDYLICLIGMVLAYVLVYFLCRRNLSVVFSTLVLVLALAFVPKIYKHYLYWPILLLVWVFVTMKAGILKDVAVGVVISICFLFRHDYGVYALISYLLTSLLFRNSIYSVFRSVLFFCSTTLCFLLITIGSSFIFSYFFDIVYVSLNKSTGLSLPHPLLHYDGSRSFFLFLLFYLLPLAGIWALRKVILRDEKYFFIFLICVLCLIQSAHRADLGHLQQAVIPSYVLMGIILGRLEAFSKKILFMAVFFALIVGSQRAVNRSLDVPFFSSRGEILSKYISENRSNKMWGDLSRELEMATAFYAFPFSPNFNYIFGKLPGGSLMLLAPGYFAGDEYQSEFIANLKRQVNPVVLWDRSIFFGQSPNSNAMVSHRMIWGYLENNFKASRYGDFVVFTKM